MSSLRSRTLRLAEGETFDGGDVVFEGVVGSTAHNLHVPGQDDRDHSGIFVELPHRILGLDQVDTVVQRSRAEGERSGPGDLDRTLYGLRKFCGLALSGNPTIQSLLFLPEEFVLVSSDLSRDLVSIRSSFASLRVVRAFLGYLKAQRERMMDQRGQKRVKRPELVEAHGFDTKYAMHAARLGRQGVEFARTGRITLPMPDPDRAEVYAFRLGERTRAEALVYIIDAEAELVHFLKENPASLPEEPETARVDAWVWRRYLAHWIERDLREKARTSGAEV